MTTNFRLISFITSLIVIISLFWLGTKPEWVSLLSANPPEDKFIHATVFGFIAALLWFSSVSPKPFIVFLISLMVGAGDELHQIYIPGRTASFADFAADSIGTMLVIAILKYTQRKNLILSLDA